MVGSNGAFNRLVVSNGATVRDNSSELGLNVSASNNVAVETGSGSVWSASGFSLGFNGAGNQLIVSNGGVLRANSSSAGISSTSSNNLAIVTGSGSLWTNAAGIQFGFGGAGNQLIVSDGGVLHSSPGFLGSGAAASSNVALVTGSGSLWTNTSELYVGHSGAGNRLMVSAGGTVRDGHGFIGASTSAPSFRSITVSGTNVIIRGTNGSPNAPFAVLTATNVATPSSNWVSLVTNQFDSGGEFSFTNPVAPGDRQRYFRIRTP
jgi:T5SS/PEP-CTERM-associated repeat protein